MDLEEFATNTNKKFDMIILKNVIHLILNVFQMTNLIL